MTIETGTNEVLLLSPGDLFATEGQHGMVRMFYINAHGYPTDVPEHGHDPSTTTPTEKERDTA
jgi:hypothetical protein